MIESKQYQASAVAIDGRAVLIEGPSGCGKSTLALALIDRGAKLIGDDGVMLGASHGQLKVSPHPNISGKLEIRGVGLVNLPVCEATAALIVDLSQTGNRLPESAMERELIGCSVPVIALGGADPASLPLRVEWALRIHGLPKEPA